jgi:four helix bundle protein
MKAKVETHCDLQVYRRAFEAAMQLFVWSKQLPKEETFSLCNQVRRSSRSVCANLAEGWRKRRYEAAFISKLSDAESEAAETQVWIEFSVRCGYQNRDAAAKLFQEYDEIIRMLVAMRNRPKVWILAK